VGRNDPVSCFLCVSVSLRYKQRSMSKYMITVSAVVDVEDEEEAEKVAQAIVNAELPDDVEEKVESLHFHDGYGNAEITKVE